MGDRNKTSSDEVSKEGVYTLKEEKAPTGYQKAEDLVIEVKSTSALQKFEMTDRFLKGKLQF